MASKKARKKKSTKERGAKRKATTREVGVEDALRELTARIDACRALRHGSILVRATGSGGGDFSIECSEHGACLGTTRGAYASTVEVMGDARTIRGVIDGRLDARREFFSGGFRVRGDIGFVSDLAVRLGFIPALPM
jgi:hypothetical protein